MTLKAVSKRKEFTFFYSSLFDFIILLVYFFADGNITAFASICVIKPKNEMQSLHHLILQADQAIESHPYIKKEARAREREQHTNC